VTSQGGPYARFTRALAGGNLLLIRAAAAELPHAPPLDDALRICVLLRDAEPAAYERAVVRWLGRFCLERPKATLADVLEAAKAFDRMPGQPEGSVRLLSNLVDRSAK
jgi:hypothetical protein